MLALLKHCCCKNSYLPPYNFGHVSLGFGFLDRTIPQYEFDTSGYLGSDYYGSTWQILNVEPFGSAPVSYDDDLLPRAGYVLGYWHYFPNNGFISTEIYDFSSYFSAVSRYLSLHPSNSRILVKKRGVGSFVFSVTEYSLSDFFVFLQSLLDSAYSDCSNLLSYNLNDCSIKYSFEILSESFINATI